MLDDADYVGIDLGIQSYVHTSDDLSVAGLDLEKEYELYAREQRVLARKEHGVEQSGEAASEGGKEKM